jgi:hypothetical protein
MKITVKSVQAMAIEAGLPDSVVERYIDSLCELVLRARKKERRQCVNNLRGWAHTPTNTRPPLHDLVAALDQTTD